MKATRDPMNRGMVFIFITLLIDVLGFGLIIPITPRLVQQLSHLSVSESALPFTELSALYGLMQFVFAPVLGSLSDRFGRRPVLLLSLFCGAVDLAFLALAPTLGWLFLGRAISGVAGASFTPATAYIADISPPEKRAQNFGLVGAAFGIGFVIGPALGGFLGGYGLRVPFWAAFALSLANCIYGYFILPESLTKENRRAFNWKEANTIGSMKLFGKYRATVMLAGMLVLSGLAQQFLQNTWILYTQYRFNWGTRENGIGLALVGLCVGAVQAGLSRKVVPRFGEPASLVVGMIISAIGFVFYGLAFASWMMYATILFWCLGGIAGPAGQAIVSKAYGPDQQGAVQGALMSLQSVCMVVGPLIAGWLFSVSTNAKLAHPLPGAVFFAAGGLSAVAALLGYLAVREPTVQAEVQAA